MSDNDVVTKALDYLRPHLELGTFAAPGWAVQLASILTGGDGCGEPVKPEVDEDDRAWGTSEDTGSHYLDLVLMSKHQLSFILQTDGKAAFAAYVNGASYHGNAHSEDLDAAIKAMGATP